MCWQGVGGGAAFYSPMIRSHSLTVPMPLDCELHMCSAVLPPSWEGQNDWNWLQLDSQFPSSMWKARVGWSWIVPTFFLVEDQSHLVLVISFPLFVLYSDKLQLVGLWLSSFTQGHNLREQDALVYFKRVPSLLPLLEVQGIVLLCSL